MKLYLYGCFIVCLLFLVLLPGGGRAAKINQAETFTLKNGMQVVVIKNDKLPVISHMIWYKIGAADEDPGKSGIAHFLEHLMFKATHKYKSGEFSKKIAKIGGNDNAFTDTDYTAYYQNIPKEALELVMELESDRMQNLTFDKQEVAKERAVILEERRARIDNDPHAQLAEQMKSALYMNHPYGRPLIGWQHEMANLKEEDAKSWYRNYYNPANAVLVISGDITADQLKPLAEKYYGDIPPGKAANRDKFIQEPPHIAARTVTLVDSKVKKEELMRYYLAPSRGYGKKEYSYALCLLSYLIGANETSVVYQDMVVKNKQAIEVSSYYDDLKLGPSIFVLHAVPSDGVKIGELEEALDKNIYNILKNGVNAQDLARAKKSIIAESIYAREDLKTMANSYGASVTLGLGLDYVEGWDKNINSVSVKDIQAAAAYIFDKKNSVTGYLLVPGDSK